MPETLDDIVSNEKITLKDYMPPEEVRVPHTIMKDRCRITILGSVASHSARKYVNVTFFGVLEERSGVRFAGVIRREYVLGHLEILKATGGIQDRNIRITRFDDRRGWASFANQIMSELKGGD